MDYFTVVEDHLFSIVRGGLDLVGHRDKEVAFSYYGVPNSKESFCRIALLELSQFGDSDVSTLIDYGKEEFSTVTHFKGLVQISFIGKDSNSMASSFDLGLRSDRRFDDLFGYSRVKLLNKSSLRRSPHLQDDTWINGWNLDLTVTFSVHTKYKFDWVEYISLNGESIKVPYREANN